MLNPLITDRINNLEPDYKSFVLSSLLTEIIQDLSAIHNFDEDTAIVFENGLAMYLLFFFDDNTFVNYLISDCNLKKQEAELLLSGIKLALPTEINTALENTQKIFFEDQTKILDEIAETESIIKTFDSNQDQNANDSNKTYTSIQSAILKDRTPIPKPLENN